MRRPRVVRRSLVGLVVLACAAASVATAAPSVRVSASRAKILTPAGVPPLYWSGQLWTPSSGCNINNACFRQLPDTVFVDSAGHLHLRMVNDNGQWWASEVGSVNEDFGYGTYRWVLDTPIRTLDPAAVVGLFTYNGAQAAGAPKGDPYIGHLEADFEITDWGTPRSKQNMQESVQPFRVPGNIRRIALPPAQRPLTFEMTWASTGTTFVVRRGAGATAPVLAHWAASTPIGTPRLGTRVLLDLWGFHGPPLSWRPQEVVIDSFSYTPSGLPPMSVSP